jgi:hypothetical protein
MSVFEHVSYLEFYTIIENLWTENEFRAIYLAASLAPLVNYVSWVLTVIPLETDFSQT